MLPDLSLFSPAHLPHQDSHGENNITRGTYDTNGPMPVLSLAKKVVKGMNASPVRVGEVVQAVDAQAAGSSSTQYCIFISYRLCESRLLAPSGHRRCKSHTTSSRNMRCRVFALGKAQDDTTHSKRCDTFPMGPMSSWWSSFFPFPTYSTGMVGKGEGPRLRELAYMDPEEAKTWDHATHPCLKWPNGIRSHSKST